MANSLDPAGAFSADTLERLYRDAYALRLSEEIDRVARGTPDSSPEGATAAGLADDALAALDPAGILSPPSIAIFYRDVYLRAVAMEVDRVSGIPGAPAPAAPPVAARRGTSSAREPAGGGPARDEGWSGTLLETDPGSPPVARTATGAREEAPEEEPSGRTLLDTDVIHRDRLPQATGNRQEAPPRESPDEKRAGSPRSQFAAWCTGDRPWERPEELSRMLGDLVCHVRSLGLYAAYGNGEAPASREIEIPFRAILRAVELGLYYDRSIDEIASLAREVLLFSAGTLVGDEDSLRSLTADFERFPEVPQALRSLPSPKRRGSAAPHEVDRAFGEKARDLAELLLRFAALTVLRPEFANPFHALGVLVQVTATGDWDPLPMRVFLGAAGVVPVGSFVALSDGSEAVVVANNPEDPLAPRVWLRGDRRGVIDLSLEPELSLKSAVLPAA